MKKRILVVDDERDIVDLITYNLTREGYDVLSASNGREALTAAAGGMDLVILDLMMPVMDGLEACRQLKNNPSTTGIPVIFLTARSGELDEILALELGADDYIQKPISPRKLVARVKALFRRLDHPAEESPAQAVVKTGRLEINRLTYTVLLDGHEVFFPRKEFEILFLLASHPGRVYTREALLNSIWGTDVLVLDRTVDVHIRKIREKLGEDDASIETVKGVGYRFRE
jgi:two-component system, OmpR family, alkaline phosphatase synthesis response regulator PhoP